MRPRTNTDNKKYVLRVDEEVYQKVLQRVQELERKYAGRVTFNKAMRSLLKLKP